MNQNTYVTKDGMTLFEETVFNMGKETLKEKFDLTTQVRIAKDKRNAGLRAKRAASKEKSLEKARARKPKSQKDKKVTQRAKEVSKVLGTGSPTCRICGKALSVPESVIAGVGPECAVKVGVTVSTPAKEADSMVDAYIEKRAKVRAKLSVAEVNEKDWMTFGEAMKAAKKAGVSGYAFMRACGGHGGMRAPLNEHFATVFKGRTRYVRKTVVKHFPDIEKAAQGK